MKRFRKRAQRDEPWKDLGGRLARSLAYTVFDCEMTGLDAKRDELIAIGAVRVREGQIIPGEHFYRLIRPETHMEKQNVLIHQLSHDQVSEGDEVAEVVAEFNAFVGSSILVAHFGKLDLAFLKKAMRRHRIAPPLTNPILDTANLYRWYRRRLDPHKPLEQGALTLANICEQLDSPIYQEHHAFYDAMTTAGLFLKILQLAEEAEVFTFSNLQRINKERFSDLN